MAADNVFRSSITPEDVQAVSPALANYTRTAVFDGVWNRPGLSRRDRSFGKLNLEGVEPYPGASKTLLNSWKPLEGKRYNPVELEHWLQAHHSEWKVRPRTSDSIRMAQDPLSHVVNVTLTQWTN